MYIQPWQIFAGGCVCGSFVTVLVTVFIVLRMAVRSGVRVEKVEGDEENGTE